MGEGNRRLLRDITGERGLSAGRSTVTDHDDAFAVVAIYTRAQRMVVVCRSLETTMCIVRDHGRTPPCRLLGSAWFDLPDDVRSPSTRNQLRIGDRSIDPGRRIDPDLTRKK